MPELITAAEFARRKGVSRPAVANALACRRIVRGPGGRIDWETESEAWERGARKRKEKAAKRPAEPDGEKLDLYTEQVRKARAEADLKELEIGRRKGQLVDIDSTRSLWFALLRGVRDRLLALPQRLGGQLAVLEDEHACRILLDREIREALSGLRDDVPVPEVR